MGVYPADHHPHIKNKHNSNCNTSTWIWNTDTFSKPGSHWIAIGHKICGNKHFYQIMDSLALLLSSYNNILESISSMQQKDVKIETFLKNHMQSTNTFTCAWWSLYYLISLKFKTSILPYLRLLNSPSINKHFLYNYFKSLFEGKWPKYILNNQHQNALSSKQHEQCCTCAKNYIKQCCKYAKKHNNNIISQIRIYYTQIKVHFQRYQFVFLHFMVMMECCQILCNHNCSRQTHLVLWLSHYFSTTYESEIRDINFVHLQYFETPPHNCFYLKSLSIVQLYTLNLDTQI